MRAGGRLLPKAEETPPSMQARVVAMQNQRWLATEQKKSGLEHNDGTPEISSRTE